MSVTRIEAEAMTLSDSMVIEDNAETSGGQVVRVADRGGSGTSETVFDGPQGTYTLTVGYFDESDGTASYQLLIDGVEVDGWIADETTGGLTAGPQSARSREITLDLEPGQTITIVSQGSRGDWARVDYLEFEPTDGSSGGGNRAPNALDDAYDATEGVPLTIDAANGVLANDGDVDGDAISITTFDTTGSAGGALTLNADGSFTYQAADGFSGAETFEYAITDPDGATDTATITFTVPNGSGEPLRTGVRLEAEDMALSPEYLVEQNGDASGGELIRVEDEDATATATTTFDGPAGTYDLVIGYFDENDGTSTYSVRVDGIEVSTWTANESDGGLLANGQSAREHIVTLDLAPGQTIGIESTQSSGEWGRLDYLELRDEGSGDGSGGGGDDGGGDPLRILAFGDSITAGVVESRNDLVTGGYRPPLSDILTERGVDFDYVGELTQDLPNLADGDHGGYSGRTIDFLDGFDQDLVASENPDIVLLMAGTNDTKLDDVPTMLADMRALLESLTDASPDLTVLVATIPPIDPEGSSASRVAKVDAYNAGLETLVADIVAEGRSVAFVDMRDLTLDEISDVDVDSGLHPNEAGYALIAQHWADAIADHLGEPVEPRIETTVASNGDITTTAFRADDSVLYQTVEDVSDTRDWEVRTIGYDDAGARSYLDFTFDNGDERYQSFHENGNVATWSAVDGSDSKIWESRSVEFWEAGGRARSDVVFDDGDTRTRTFYEDGSLATWSETDGSDAKVWASRSIEYWESGERARSEIVFDDGDTRTSTFYEDGTLNTMAHEDNSNSETWASWFSVWNEDGVRERIVFEQDNGDLITGTFRADGTRESRTVEDISDTRDWASFIDTYDQNGDFIERTYTYDDGMGLA